MNKAFFVMRDQVFSANIVESIYVAERNETVHVIDKSVGGWLNMSFPESRTFETEEEAKEMAKRWNPRTGQYIPMDQLISRSKR